MCPHIESVQSGPPATYLVSVVGELGAVLRAAFSDYQTVVAPASTVFRLRVPSEDALADVRATLSASGLEVVSLRRLPDPAPMTQP
jgi:hypothetical protein